MSYPKEYPIVTNTIIRRETAVRNIEKPALYITGSYQTLSKTIVPGVIYTNKNLVVGYRYDFSLGSHDVTLGWRIK